MGRAEIGAWVADFTPDRADQFGFRDHFKGALVTRSEGLGALAGLRPGTVIIKVDNKPVESAKEAADAVAKGSLEKGILMQIRSAHGGTSKRLITIAAVKPAVPTKKECPNDNSPVVRSLSASRSSIFLLLGSDSAFQMRSVRERFTCDQKVTC